MSFQGDVAGIGLGELLQGLSRGGRDGVLSLYGSSQSAAIGLHKGQLFILAGPDEEETEWRDRAQRAWVDDIQPSMESARRTSIARAARLESIYRLLDAPNLHFRFEPGPLPIPPHIAAKQASVSLGSDDTDNEAHVQAWGMGMTVEYMLLEHARITDESSTGPAANLKSFDMPRSLDASSTEVNSRDFLEQCDGSSTAQEIADRLGYTLSQCRQVIGEHMQAGRLRFAQPRELLAAAQRELAQGRIGRAATRLGGWVISAPPGPPDVGDADLLVSEWEQGHLPHILSALQPNVARSLLRKLDSVHMDVNAARERWAALYSANRGDDIALLHEVALRLAATEEPEARTFHDLLRLARNFRERGFENRTRTLLRLTSNHMPSKPQTRVELGRQMLAAGLEEEGRAWLLDTAKDLLAQGDGERAIIPIRAVLREEPDDNEANGLLLQTRGLMARKKRRRWNTMAALSGGLVLALVGFVKYSSYRRVENKLAEISGYMGQPEVALSMLEEAFGNDPDPKVADLRTQIYTQLKEAEQKRLVLWDRRFREIQEQCQFGDIQLALRRVLEMPPPPDHEGDKDSWQQRQDLLGTLASRFEERSDELDLPADATEDELAQEGRLIESLAEALAVLPPRTPSPEISTFRFHLDELRSNIETRRARRGVERTELLQNMRQRDQSILLATARAHHKAGDLARSLQAYDLLLDGESELASLPELADEIETVRRQWSAIQRARDLCARGEHDAAYGELVDACPRPVEFPMPWRIDTRPSGARVTTGDGSVHVTPFVMRSGFGEEIRMTIERDGCVPREFTLTKPRDLVLSLHVHPDRAWFESHTVEAAPVPVGDDHIVADRAGKIARINETSEAEWTVTVESLGGIARTPVFLPRKPGFLIVLTEDGSAWLLNAATGSLHGPRDIGHPPEEGPTITRGGVSAKFSDGRVALWTTGLEPTFYDANGLVNPTEQADRQPSERDSSLIVHRRGADREPMLVSPWTDWSVEALEDEFRVVSPSGDGFTAERSGSWEYMAWEAPKALLPLGRLWVSDGKGLRSYVPE